MNEPPRNLAGYDPLRNTAGCRWDGEAAARAVDFFADVLTHPDDSKFTKAGSKFVLCDWQRDYIATLYGWKRPDGSRRYTESLAGLPRKNGKSTLAAGLILLELTAMGRRGAQIYSAAQSRDQAALIYSMAARMMRNSRHLSRRLDAIDSTKRITYKTEGNFYRAIPADAGPVHGTKPAVVIFDELHTQKNRDLYDALKTGQGATSDPLFLSITTAGYDRHSICFQVWNRARQVRDGESDDPYFLPLLYELGDKDDWSDESIWHRCNPNLGQTISLDFLREHHQQAKDSPSYENTFRNLYLNQWTEQAVRWLSMDKWRMGNGELPDLRGEPCWAAIDLSTTKDITALALAFPRADGGYYLIARFWVPNENARKRERMDGVPYPIWANDQHLFLTEGDWIDQGAIRNEVNKLAEEYRIQEIAVDPWNGAPLMQALMEDGFEVVEHRQGFGSMAGPTKEFDRLVTAGKIQHGGHPVLMWMAGNVAVEKDSAENIKPCKKKSTERIDGIVAAVMAVGRAQVAQGTESYYDSHEVEMA